MPYSGAILFVVVGAALVCDPDNGDNALSQERVEAPEALKARLIEEYPAHARRLRAAIANVHCTYSVSSLRTTPEKVTRRASKGDLYLKGESREVVRAFAADQEEFGGQQDVFCITPDQIFELRKVAPDDSYIIDSFDDTAKKEKAERASITAFTRIDSIIEAALRTRDVPVSELLQRGNIETIRHVRKDGHAYLEISLRFEPRKYYKSCTVWLDPNMDYAVSGYDNELWPVDDGRRQRRRKGTVRCQRTKDGFVVPTHLVEEMSVVDESGKRITIVWEYRIEVVSSGDLPDSQFTLAAFGLPEITLRPRRRWYPVDRWYFWSLVLIAIVGWLYVRKKARAQRVGETAR